MFKDRLNQAMQDLNLNQTKLSQLTGIGKSSISQYLSGKNEPTEKRQGEIAAALGLPHDYFSEGDIAVEVKKHGSIPRLTLTETAKIMGISKDALANGLQDGVYPWGYAMRGRGTKRIYFINAKRFAEIEGIDLGVK